MERFQDLMLYNLNESQSVLTDNNDVRIFTDGKEKFKALIAEMEHAGKYIHIQYYIIKNDELWQKIEEVLIRKVQQGVEVRILFDSMGCRTMRNRDWRRHGRCGDRGCRVFPGTFGKTSIACEF